MDPEQVRETLRQWISTDDEIRALQNQIKELRDRKNALGGQVLEFMRGNNLDNFVIEGGVGTIARQQRTVRAKPGKAVVRAQLAMILADQPQRMVEVLRVLEGVPAGGEDDTNSLTTRELLTRRLPRTQHITLG
jgi:ATP/maltotriose-dependent transcriptional regulator MalT